MTIKKVCTIGALMLLLAVVARITIHYFQSSKQLYGGVLVFNDGQSVEQLYDSGYVT